MAFHNNIAEHVSIRGYAIITSHIIPKLVWRSQQYATYPVRAKVRRDLEDMVRTADVSKYRGVWSPIYMETACLQIL